MAFLEKLQVHISFNEKCGHLKAQIFDVEVSVTDVETFRELVFRFFFRGHAGAGRRDRAGHLH